MITDGLVYIIHVQTAAHGPLIGPLNFLSKDTDCEEMKW